MLPLRHFFIVTGDSNRLQQLIDSLVPDHSLSVDKLLHSIGRQRLLRDYIHPRRFWLWYHHRQEILESASVHCPRPYDLGAILFEERTGVPIATPNRLAVYPQDQLIEPKNRHERVRLSVPARPKRGAQPERWIAGGEALGLYGANVLEKFLAIDSHVYETMARLGHAQVEAIGDLSAELKAWAYSPLTGLEPGGLHMFAGHLGEVYVAEHVTAAGASVEWPEVSNQKAWDLLVGGHEVNVKTVSDGAELAEHFAKYPDVAVIVPGDMTNIPDGAFHLDSTQSVDGALDRYLDAHQDRAVIVDKALSHTEVTEQAVDVSDAALGAASIVEVHLPWVTVATAGWRELTLLTKAKTDLKSAAKNLALDVGGRGGGAAAGATAGAIVGGVAGPIGSVIGVLIGGIAGAVYGSKAAGYYKSIPYEQARKSYLEAKRELHRLASRVEEDAAAAFDEARREEGQRLKPIAEQASRNVKAAADYLQAFTGAVETLPTVTLSTLLGGAIEEIGVGERRAHENLQKMSRFRRWLWPTPEVLAWEQVQSHCRSASGELARLGNGATTSGVRRSEVYGELARFGLARTQVRNDFRALEADRQTREAEARETIAEVNLNLVKQRVGALRRLELRAAQLVAQVRVALEPAVQICGQRVAELNEEAGKLGRA
jgi:hypothetical protein